MNPKEVGYAKVLAELKGQPLTKAEIAARLAAPDWTPTVQCACGKHFGVPAGTVETRCYTCTSRLAWTPHGWATLGLMPPNVTCPCGKRFGIPPDHDTAHCFRCGAHLIHVEGRWTPELVGDAVVNAICKKEQRHEKED